MQALDLYGRIQEYLGFEEEINTLYKATLLEILKRDITEVLDIGCGQGQFCKILELNSIKSLGVDLSSTQIELAKQHFPELEFKAIDIKNLDTKYQAATATFDVINYIDNKGLEEFFTSVYNCLHHNGYFIFDINTLFGFEEIAQGSLIIDEDNLFIGIDANFEKNTLFTDITVFNKENTHYNKQQGTITQHYHSLENLQKVLKKCGFSIETKLDFVLHSDDENDKMIIICKRD